jgi:hypothetical protein
MKELLFGNTPVQLDPIKSHKPLSKGMTTLEGQVNNSADQLLEQMEILVKRAKDIQERKRISKIIYSAKMGFEPLVKSVYHLYFLNEYLFISMIGPKEWGRKKMDYIATIQLDYDHTWEVLELNKKDFFNI